jgi:glutamate/tyrosine decarboxylase-like PLP-dependent enzyme
MADETTAHREESLDPVAWDRMSALGRRMVDEMMEYLRTVRERPVWRPLPDEVKESFRLPLPQSPQESESVYDDFRRLVMPYPTGNIHPRFWGWVMGNGTPYAMLAEMLAAGLNINQGGGAQSGGLVEMQVIEWCKEMMGFPSGATGLLVSGGSMANLVGLAVARNAMAGYDIRAEGVQGAKRPMTIYASTEVHSSVQKGVELLGLGSKALRLVPVDKDFAIDVQALRRCISEDRARGMQPVCIVGCAGTVNTGAFDDLQALADICRDEKIWFHVDGAFGALAALSPELRSLVRGMERADSVAFDMHKWMYLPYEVGCTLVRDGEAHRRTFALTPEYLEHSNRGIAGSDVWLSDYGVQLSRGFRALKVWMTIKEHGIRKFGRLILQNVEQARYLERLVRAEPRLELVAPVPCNIVCFRYVGRGHDPETLNTLNKELLYRLHESGVAAPSYTTLGERYALRVCITNYRSRFADFDLLVREVLRCGTEIEQSLPRQ